MTFNIKLLTMKLVISSFVLSLFIPLSLSLSYCSKPNAIPVDTANKVQPYGLKTINSRVMVGAPLEIARGNEKYIDVIKSDFNTGQGLWYGRWGGWSGEQLYDFAELNQNVNWMKDNGLSPTVHMLVGPDTYMPNWLVNGTWQGWQLDNLLRQLVYAIMDSNNNKDKIDVWNVANELFDDDGTYRDNMVWLKMGYETDKSGLSGTEKINAQHPIFIRKVFSYCREKTFKKLEIRDFNIESDQPSSFNYRKTKALFQLVKHMKNSGIPVDAVGIQGHLTIGKSAWIFQNNTLQTTVNKFKSLGVEVHITELDIRTDGQTWNTTLANKQREDYNNYVKQAIRGGANRIFFWGIQDNFDPFWLQNEYPLPWDANLERKPAYYGVKDALEVTK
jgi:GH35 family endo-1,4-beta-xylanase